MTASYRCVLRFFMIFPHHLSKVLRLPRNSDARSYEVLQLSRQIILANLKSWCSKMQPLSGNQCLHLRTSLITLCSHKVQNPFQWPRKMQNPFQRPQKMTTTSKSGPNVVHLVFFGFEMCFPPQERALFQHLNFQRLSECDVLYIFCLRTVLHAHLNSQKWSGAEVLWEFDFEMCFAPPRRAPFEHLIFQKCSEHGMRCTVWLRNALRATVACTFSTSQRPKLVRTWNAFSFLASKSASRHNGLQFFISHPATWLRTGRFSEPTFRPSRATKRRKT